MKALHLAISLVLGAFCTLAATGTANAAPAYASDKISIFELPRYQSNEIVGMLWAGEPVTIDRCTPSGKWCRVFHDGPTGWVPASYLIGAAAKADATPLQTLASPAFPEQKDGGRTHHGF